MAKNPSHVPRIGPLQRVVAEPITDPAEQAALDEQRRRIRENRRPGLNVAVAVVFEPERGFFLTYHPHWHGYTFPMRKQRQTDVSLAQGALEALREATALPLRGATAQPLVTLEVEGASQRTGQPTLYHYHVFQIDSPVTL